MPTADDVKARVMRMLAKHVQVRVDQDGDIVAQHESAVCFVRCSPFNPGHSLGGMDVVVKLFAPILWDVDRTPALYEWVATEGQGFIIGRVACNPTSDRSKTNVFFEYNLLGDNLDEPEVVHALGITLSMANGLDDQLQPRFGGRKSIE